MDNYEAVVVGARDSAGYQDHADYVAEHDPSTNDVIVANGYKIHDGVCDVPPAPGFGLAIDEERFRSDAKVRFDLKL